LGKDKKKPTHRIPCNGGLFLGENASIAYII